MLSYHREGEMGEGGGTMAEAGDEEGEDGDDVVVGGATFDVLLGLHDPKALTVSFNSDFKVWSSLSESQWAYCRHMTARKRSNKTTVWNSVSSVSQCWSKYSFTSTDDDGVMLLLLLMDGDGNGEEDDNDDDEEDEDVDVEEIGSGGGVVGLFDKKK